RTREGAASRGSPPEPRPTPGQASGRGAGRAPAGTGSPARRDPARPPRPHDGPASRLVREFLDVPFEDVGDGVGVDVERLLADVLDRVARLVVAGVERLARRAAEPLRVGLRLPPFRPGEQPAGGDADLDERAVVRTAVEVHPRVRQAARGVEVLEVLLDLR